MDKYSKSKERVETYNIEYFKEKHNIRTLYRILKISSANLTKTKKKI